MASKDWTKFENCLFRIQFSEVEKITSSESFIVVDERGGQNIIDSSGKASSNYKYNFKSMGFSENLGKVLQTEKISHIRPTPIPSIKGTDQVTVRESKHEKFTPITKSNVNIFSFEKSVFQAISRDMINFISGVKSFNNLIGEPVNKYRKNYKLLTHIRERYFSNVLNEPDFERYLNYYKWIDSAIGTILGQMIPASAFSNTGIEDVVESHALERSKYDHKYSRFERKEPNLSTSLLAINELLYDWEHGHFASAEDEHCLWQKDRKERPNQSREAIRKVLTTVVTGSGWTKARNYVLRNLVKPYKHSVDEQANFSIGHNRQANKIKDLYKIINTGKEITIDSSDFYEFKKCDDVIDPQREKLYVAKTNTTDTDGYLDADADLILPFSFYSSSVGEDFDIFKQNLKITNNIEMPESIQSTVALFFDQGPSYRNVKIGTPKQERPEAYEISASSDRMTIRKSNTGPTSLYVKGLLGNRLYRTANVKTKLSDDGVVAHGNYEKDYEIVMTNGRLQNNNYLTEKEGRNLTGSLELSSYVVGMLNFNVPVREKREHVIVNRFSPIGAPETSAKSFLDRVSEEYSIYSTVNYRNPITRGIYNMLSKEGSEKFGYRRNSILTGSIHKTNRNYNRFTGSFGKEKSYDNFFVTHQIPQNDFGYSWITASVNESVYSFLDKNANIGHQHHFHISGGLESSETINFLTASILGTNNQGSGTRGFPAEVQNSPPPWTPLSFAGLNTIIQEPVSNSENQLGFPLSRGIGNRFGHNHISRVIFDGIYEYYFNNDTLGMLFAQASPEGGTVAGLNSIILHRQGPYGWPSWKQVRTSQHPIVRSHRKNNIISGVFRGVSPFPSCHGGVNFEYNNTIENHNAINGFRTIKNYEEIMATSKFNPITVTRHMFQSVSGVEFLAENIPIPPQVPQWALALMWWNDEFLHEYITKTESIAEIIQIPSLSMRVPLQNTVTGYANQEMADDFRYKEKSILSTKNIKTINSFIESESAVQGATFLEVNYIETVYPREINTFTKEAREREIFDFFGWKASRDDRTLILNPGHQLFSPTSTANISYSQTIFLDSSLEAGGNHLWLYAPTTPIVIEEDYRRCLFNSYEAIDAIMHHPNSQNIINHASSPYLELSRWPMDSRKDYSQLPVALTTNGNSAQYLNVTGPGGLNERSQMQTGILQNEFSIYPMGGNAIRGSAPFAPVYNRRIPQDINVSGSTSETIDPNQERTPATYKLADNSEVVASVLASSYEPWIQNNDDSFPTSGDLRFNLAESIKTQSGSVDAGAYLFLSSKDMHDTDPDRRFPANNTQQGNECEFAAQELWDPTPFPASAFPRGETFSGSIELQSSIDDDITQIEDVDFASGEKVYFSFTDLTMSFNTPEDWTIRSSADNFNQTPLWQSQTPDSSWATDTNGGRKERRVYRNGTGWLYKVNPTNQTGYAVLAKYNIPTFTLEIDWDDILTNQAIIAGLITGDLNENFITATAELELIFDNTAKLTGTPWSSTLTGNQSVTVQSSTAPLAGGIKRLSSGTETTNVGCPEERWPYTSFFAETEANGGQNFIFLSDPATATETTTTIADTVLAGEALWETAVNTEFGPFYDEYIDFAEETRLVGQQYSLVSEFTISRYIEDIYASQDPRNPTVGDDFLQLTGAVYHSSSGDISIGTQFFKTYSNSDFMKYFAPFRKNITENGFNLADGRITMRCSAVKRLLPYRGFYPAERTVQISEIFNRNYLKKSSYRADYIPNNLIIESQAEDYLKMKIQNLKAKVAKPFFQPGILYNSIKTGLAVDYPLFASDLSTLQSQRAQLFPITEALIPPNLLPNVLLEEISKIPYTGSVINNTIDTGIPRIKGTVERRVAFEDLLDPVLLLGQTIYENEPHPSASNLYGNIKSYRVQEDQPKFGMINEEEARIYNAIELDQNWQGTVNSLKPYTSAIHNFASETVRFFLEDEKLQTIVSQPAKPMLQSGVNYMMRVYVNNKNTVMYDRHSAFGPPVDDGNPLVKKYIWDTDLGSPASASISFVGAFNPALNAPVALDLEDDTITIDDHTSSNEKTFIFKKEVVGVTASANIVFQPAGNIDHPMSLSPAPTATWQGTGSSEFFAGYTNPNVFFTASVPDSDPSTPDLPFLLVYYDPNQYRVPMYTIAFSNPNDNKVSNTIQAKFALGAFGPQLQLSSSNGPNPGKCHIVFYDSTTTPTGQDPVSSNLVGDLTQVIDVSNISSPAQMAAAFKDLFDPTIVGNSATLVDNFVAINNPNESTLENIVHIYAKQRLDHPYSLIANSSSMLGTHVGNHLCFGAFDPSVPSAVLSSNMFAFISTGSMFTRFDNGGNLSITHPPANWPNTDAIFGADIKEVHTPSLLQNAVEAAGHPDASTWNSLALGYASTVLPVRYVQVSNGNGNITATRTVDAINEYSLNSVLIDLTASIGSTANTARIHRVTTGSWSNGGAGALNHVAITGDALTLTPSLLFGSTPFGGGVDGAQYTNASLDDQGRTIIRIVGEAPLPSSIASSASAAIGHATNGFNHPTGMIVTHETGSTQVLLTQSVNASSGNKLITTSDFQLTSNIVGFSGARDPRIDPYLSASVFTKSGSHGFLPYVAPYLDPDTAPYALMSFTPAETREYTIPEIQEGLEITYFNMEAPSNWATNTNWKEAMAISASINLKNSILLYTDNHVHLGADPDKQTVVNNPSPDLYRWVIQPKWETPILNFKDEQVSTLDTTSGQVVKTSGSVWKTRYQTEYYSEFSGSSIPYLTSSTGMWHQKGTPTILTPDEGYYLTIVGPQTTTGDKLTRGNLAREVGFTNSLAPTITNSSVAYGIPEEANFFTTSELGRVAEEKLISEAVVAIPYYLTEDCDIKFFTMRNDVYQVAMQKNKRAREEYIQHMRLSNSLQESDNIQKEYDRFFESTGLGAIDSAAYQIRMMDKYIMPPQFDFNRNLKITPYVAYVFQFKAKLDRQDLSDIWQNIYPTSKEGVSIAQHSSVKGTEIECDVEYITHLLGSGNSPLLKGNTTLFEEPGKFLESDVRWLVFKIKYRAEGHYKNVVEDSITRIPENVMEINSERTFGKNPQFTGKETDREIFSNYGYNWPYDYFSLVELIKVESKVDFLSESELVRESLGISEQQEAEEQDSGGIDVEMLGASILDKIVPRQVLKEIQDPIPINPDTLIIPLNAGETIRAGSETVYLNGVLQTSGNGNDYTISGNQIIFADNLESTDSVQVSFIKI